jgi:hypothetical protein
MYVEAVPFAVLGLARCFIDSARVFGVDLVTYCASGDCSAGLHIPRGVYAERHQLYYMRYAYSISYALCSAFICTVAGHISVPWWVNVRHYPRSRRAADRLYCHARCFDLPC